MPDPGAQGTTIGRLLLEDAVPPALRGSIGVLDKKGQAALFQLLAEHHPDLYRQTAKALSDVALRGSYESGGYSFGPHHLRADPETEQLRNGLKEKVRQILADGSLTEKQRNDRLVHASLEAMTPLEEAAMKGGLASGNPVAMQVASGAKGKPENFKSLVAGDTLYQDANYNPVPIPVTNSFYEGLTPSQFYAGTFGARLAIVLTKLGTAAGGWSAKRLGSSAHRLVVTARDRDPGMPEEEAARPVRGLSVPTNDPDNEGALLAKPTGDYPANTVLTRYVLDVLRKQGVKDLLVRSPMVGGPPDGGVYGHDVGVMERGRIAPVGDYVGLTAAQSIAEPMTQSLISSKHSGGVAGRSQSQQGFPVLDRLISIPSQFPGGAAHAQKDGLVASIREAPQGGRYVLVDGEEHYAPPEQEVLVKPGDHVEAGDPLTDGVVNPSQIVTHKGIGEGRRRFVETFDQIARNSGFRPHRRNLELMARGLIDHVQLDAEVGDHVPGDVVSYTALEHAYEPRPDAKQLSPKDALGHHLEVPVLHYSIGTRVTPSMLPRFETHGIKTVTAHPSPPPFTPLMVRSHDVIGHDPDPFTRMLGSNLEKGLLRGVHRGDVSDPYGTSFVPALAQGTDFGTKGKTVGWKADGAG